MALVFGLIGCDPEAEVPPEEERVQLDPISFETLPGWRTDRVSDAWSAILTSCARLGLRPADEPLGVDGFAGRVSDWLRACQQLQADRQPEGDDDVRRRLESLFRPYAVRTGSQTDGLFTGYMEATLSGSLTPDHHHQYPIHARPNDLVEVDLGAFRTALRGERISGRLQDGRLIPYFDRASIDAGALRGRGLEIAWVHDPIDAFFLHIQGSGRIELPDGGVLRVGYAAQNGHPYVAIGRELIARGALRREDVSMQSIRAWLAQNPALAQAVLHSNPSYIFFRVLSGPGPIGAQGVPLTPGRSIAVDPRFMPLGVPMFIDVADPVEAGERIRRLVVAQDTGGAIRGPIRGDLFWGHGPDAEERAGRMRSQGRWWVLVPHWVRTDRT